MSQSIPSRFSIWRVVRHFENEHTFIKDRRINVEEDPDQASKREDLIISIESGRWQWKVVLVAGLGFFSAAYQIFATNLTLPILAQLYGFDDTQQMCLRITLLIGVITGQLFFGLLADLYGRQKYFGYELRVLVIAGIGICMSAESPAMRCIYRWLLFWRLVMGFGIGGDYPLSAVLTAEFASTEHRARMLACVFFCQPLGYFMATIVTMAALGGTGASPSQYRLDCAWRWVVGVGVFFAIIAAYFRRKIPESPRFTADVLYRPEEALRDYISLKDVDTLTDSGSLEAGNTSQRRTPLVENSQDNGVLVPDSDNRNEIDAITTAPTSAYQADVISSQRSHGHSGENAETRRTANPSNGGLSNTSVDSGVMRNGDIHLQTFHHTTDEAYGSSLGRVPTPQQPQRHIIDQSFESRWKCYWTEFGQTFPASFQRQTPTLFAVSFCWCMLDLIYYALLGPGSSRVVTLFITEDNGLLFASTWKVMILLICGSVGGGLVMIYLVKMFSPRHLQIQGFATVTILILIFGVVLIEVKDDDVFNPWGILFYIIASISFEVGANFTTFMLPAELFPTRQRAFAVGIAAASGKIGAVVIQPFVRYATYHGKYGYASEDRGLASFWVGFATVSWIGAPLLGLVVTYVFIPQTRLTKEGNANQPLDILYTLPTPMQIWRKERRDQAQIGSGAADESSRTSSR